MSKNNVVLYDGYCHYCFFWVKILYRLSYQNSLEFIPLSSNEGRKIKENYHITVNDRHSLIYIKHGDIYMYLEAVEKIFSNHSNDLFIHRLLGVIPRWLGKLMYLYLFSIPSKFTRSSKICVIPSKYRRNSKEKEEINKINS